MTENLNPPPVQTQKNNQVLYVAIGAVVLCCVCCAAALLAQWILQNSDFTLVDLPAQISRL